MFVQALANQIEIVIVSIIIPVYNTEPYLPACLDSILSQSFTDFEVLLVDDGSTDGSGAVCEAYAAKDSRIRVFHKENGGVSSARNLGLDHAVGEWVYFADSDDELLPEGLQILVNSISDDVDLVMGGYEKRELDGLLVIHYDGDVHHIKMDKKESFKTLFQKYARYYPYLGWMWLRLFRNSVIKREAIRFDTEIRIKEDTLFTAEYICRSSGNTCFVTDSVYLYKLREDSAMGPWRKSFDYKYLDSLYALVKIKNVVTQFFPPYSESVFIANEGIWARYNDILYKMRMHGVKNEGVTHQMKSIIRKELDIRFFIRKKVRKIKRKWLKIQ